MGDHVQPDKLPRLLRFADLQARGIFPNREALRVAKEKHGFPAGFRLLSNMQVYDEDEVAAWLQSRRVAPKVAASGAAAVAA